VQVKYRLPRALPGIEDGSIPARELPLARQLRRHQQHLANDILIAWRGLVQRRKMFAWTDENVCRRLRIDILKREDFAVFEHHLDWNLFAPNLAKQAVR